MKSEQIMSLKSSSQIGLIPPISFAIRYREKYSVVQVTVFFFSKTPNGFLKHRLQNNLIVP